MARNRIPTFADKMTGFFLSLAAILLLAAALFTGPAFGHSWYPNTCCGGMDCKPVPCDQLVEDNNGWWKYLPTGNLFHPSQVQPSQDQFCHVCVGMFDHRSLCAFVQSSV